MSAAEQGCPLGHVSPVGPTCSHRVVLTTSTEKFFPNLDDYVKWLVEGGYISSKDDLFSGRTRWCSEIMFDWFRRGQEACVFAVQLARADPPWDSIIENAPLDDLGTRLTVHLDGISASNGEAAQVVLPSVRTAEDVVGLINALCKNERWYWNEVAWDQGTPTSLLVGLRWILPSNLSVNHVLGFANLDTLPVTRRSPFTTLVLRTIDHKRSEIKTEGGRQQVHLADMDSTLYPQSKHDQVWDATKKLKRQFVQENGPLWAAARARVTFALPLELRSKLCPAGEHSKGL